MSDQVLEESCLYVFPRDVAIPDVLEWRCGPGRHCNQQVLAAFQDDLSTSHETHRQYTNREVP